MNRIGLIFIPTLAYVIYIYMYGLLFYLFRLLTLLFTFSEVYAFSVIIFLFSIRHPFCKLKNMVDDIGHLAHDSAAKRLHSATDRQYDKTHDSATKCCTVLGQFIAINDNKTQYLIIKPKFWLDLVKHCMDNSIFRLRLYFLCQLETKNLNPDNIEPHTIW